MKFDIFIIRYLYCYCAIDTINTTGQGINVALYGHQNILSRWCKQYNVLSNSKQIQTYLCFISFTINSQVF